MYSRANGNGRAALRMYYAQFCDQQMTNHRMFQLLHRQLSETNSFHITRIQFFMETSEGFVSRISEATSSVHEIPGIFERVHQSLHRRCQACITTGGHNFE